MTTDIPPRIFRVRYRSAIRRRVADFFVKVPIGGYHGMLDALGRAQLTHQVIWFRVDVALPGQITPEVRSDLKRWTEAIDYTTDITEVDWTR